jgi:hypothetical protein
VQCQAELLEIVLTLGSSSRFSRLLHGWQQQCDQHGNDRDYDQQFD